MRGIVTLTNWWRSKSREEKAQYARPQIFLARLRERQELKRFDEMYRGELRRFYRGEPIQAEDFARKKLAAMLEYSSRHVTFYKGLDLGNNKMDSFERLRRFPILDKQDMRRQYEEMKSDILHTMPVNELRTGGSTGEPFGFLGSTITGRLTAIHQEAHFEALGFQPGDFIASFGGTTIPERDREAGIFWKWIRGHNERGFGAVHFSALYLDDRSTGCIAQYLMEIKPNFLRGYPSFIHAIAKWFLDQGMEAPFPVKGIQLTSENSFPSQLGDIQKVFKAVPHGQWGQTENCSCSFTLPGSDEYLFSPYLGWTEVLDEHDEPVMPGQIGEIIVTTFYNRAMPFIRYRTGDHAQFHSLEGGVLRTGPILGRTQDYVVNRNGDKVFLTALVFGQHYHAFDHMKKWQIRQTEVGKVTILVVPDEQFSEADVAEIKEKFGAVGQVETEVERVSEIPPTRAGKSKLLVQELDAPTS